MYKQQPYKLVSVRYELVNSIDSGYYSKTKRESVYVNKFNHLAMGISIYNSGLEILTKPNNMHRSISLSYLNNGARFTTEVTALLAAMRKPDRLTFKHLILLFLNGVLAYLLGVSSDISGSWEIEQGLDVRKGYLNTCSLTRRAWLLLIMYIFLSLVLLVHVLCHSIMQDCVQYSIYQNAQHYNRELLVSIFIENCLIFSEPCMHMTHITYADLRLYNNTFHQFNH